MRGWLLAAVCVAYWLTDVSAVRVWRSPETLWTHAAQVTPRSVRASGNHLRMRFEAGDHVEGR